MVNKVSVGFIGCGYWGSKLLPKFFANPHCQLRTACDLDPRLRASVSQQFPGLATIDSYDAVLDDAAVTTVVLATPPATHYGLARKALEAGKHVWIEKPLATNLAQGR